MLVDITQNDWILEKILVYFSPSSLFKFRLVNHTWNRVALQLLNSPCNRTKYAIKLSTDNVHEYMDQIQLLLQLSQNEQCIKINPYHCLLPTELRINLCSSSPNSNESNIEPEHSSDGWNDNHFNCSQMVYDTIHRSLLRFLRIDPSRQDDKLQHSILKLLRADLLALQLVQQLKQQDKSSQRSTCLFQQLDQDYEDFRTMQRFFSRYRPRHTYQACIINVLLILGGSNQWRSSMIHCTYIEIPLQSGQLLDELRRFYFRNLKTLACVVNAGYNLWLIMKLGGFLKHNCPVLESLELHFCNTGFCTAGAGAEEDTRTVPNELYPILPKMTHFGLVLPKTANRTYFQQILNILELASLKYSNLTSIHLDFNVCLKLGEGFPRDSSGVKVLVSRRHSQFGSISFSSVKILKFTLPASIIIKSEAEFSVIKYTTNLVLGWLFPRLDKLVLQMQEPNPATTIRTQNLMPFVGRLQGRYNRLDDFVYLLMEWVGNVRRIEIYNYYQNWVGKASFKRYDIRELKLTIPTHYNKKDLKWYDDGNNWSEVCLESILKKFPHLRRLEISTELLYKSNSTTPPHNDSIENALRKFKECVVADESQVQIQLF